MKKRSSLQRDPVITEMPTEEAVELLMRVYGEDEATARLMVEVAKGEFEGDAHSVADDPAMPAAPQRRAGKARAS